MCCCPEGSKPILEGYLADEKLHSLTHGVRTPELVALAEGSESALRPVSVTVLGEIGLANARAWNLGWMASLLSPVAYLDLQIIRLGEPLPAVQPTQRRGLCQVAGLHLS